VPQKIPGIPSQTIGTGTGARKRTFLITHSLTSPIEQMSSTQLQMIKVRGNPHNSLITQTSTQKLKQASLKLKF
jgi:hypothetical protein